jgi:hypothetical protein
MACALNAYLGDDGIQVGAWYDTLNSGGVLNHRAKKILKSKRLRYFSKAAFLSTKHLSLSARYSVMNDLITEYYTEHHGFDAGAHVSAVIVKREFPEFFESFHKFCVVRNPWDRVVSDYYWRLSSRGLDEKNIGFDYYVSLLEDKSLADPLRLRPIHISNYPIYTIEGDVVADTVIKYENLLDDISLVEKELGLNINLTKYKAKTNIRPKEYNLYTESLFKKVYKIYKAEVDLHGYTGIPGFQI